SARAILGLPDGTTRRLTLHDDGLAGDAFADDGIYSGQFTETAEPGNYSVVLQAFGTALSTPSSFSRETFALATASQSSSAFAGTYRDRGVDSDGDGLFNQLDVDVDLNLTTAATY